MGDYIKNACEEIDAAMFSGDAFEDAEERAALIQYMGRWQRQLTLLEKPAEDEVGSISDLNKSDTKHKE